jgi:hypothetical protein
VKVLRFALLITILRILYVDFFSRLQVESTSKVGNSPTFRWAVLLSNRHFEDTSFDVCIVDFSLRSAEFL